MPEVLRPTLAVSIGIFRDGRVLLAARGKAPMRGVYTFPGGRVEPGETLTEAVLRECAEEIGLVPRVIGFIEHVEIIARDDAGAVTRHFIVAAFAGVWQGGEPHLSDEATDVRWVDPQGLDGLPVTDGLPDIVRRGAELVRQAGF